MSEMFLVDCGAPSTSDGYTLGNVGGTTFGQTVPFSCATGYNGDEGEIQCQADQSWSQLSGCVIVSKLLAINISPSYKGCPNSLHPTYSEIGGNSWVDIEVIQNDNIQFFSISLYTLLDEFHNFWFMKN